MISAKNNTTGFKYRVKYKSLQKFIWKNKLSPLLKTQEKDFQLCQHVKLHKKYILEKKCDA